MTELWADPLLRNYLIGAGLVFVVLMPFMLWQAWIIQKLARALGEGES